MTLPHSESFRYRPHIFAASVVLAAVLTLYFEQDRSQLGALALIGVLWSAVGFASFWVFLHVLRLIASRELPWFPNALCLFCFYFFSTGSVLLVVLVLAGFDIGAPESETSLFFATSPGGFAVAAAASSVRAKMTLAA